MSYLVPGYLTINKAYLPGSLFSQIHSYSSELPNRHAIVKLKILS